MSCPGPSLPSKLDIDWTPNSLRSSSVARGHYSDTPGSLSRRPVGGEAGTQGGIRVSDSRQGDWGMWEQVKDYVVVGKEDGV